MAQLAVLEQELHEKQRMREVDSQKGPDRPAVGGSHGEPVLKVEGPVVACVV